MNFAIGDAELMEQLTAMVHAPRFEPRRRGQGGSSKSFAWRTACNGTPTAEDEAYTVSYEKGGIELQRYTITALTQLAAETGGRAIAPSARIQDIKVPERQPVSRHVPGASELRRQEFK